MPDLGDHDAPISLLTMGDIRSKALKTSQKGQ
jgi:hypothetical protein